jgi:ERCC4-type nuclease
VNLLFNTFKSIDKIKLATKDELKKVKGIGEKLAINIYDYFHKD